MSLLNMAVKKSLSLAHPNRQHLRSPSVIASGPDPAVASHLAKRCRLPQILGNPAAWHMATSMRQGSVDTLTGCKGLTRGRMQSTCGMATTDKTSSVPDSSQSEP